MTTIDEVFDAMGEGMRLFVPSDGSQCLLIDGLTHWGGHEKRPDIEVSSDLFGPLIKSGLISKLTENRTVHKTGWRESGLSEYGVKGDIYACTQ